ncbi:MAG: YeeE/YedE family protein [Chitinophagaceae bacterium]
MTFIELIKQPWPWYVAGPIIGLMVPALLIFGNKTFGISSSLRHVCAACMPAKIPFFQYDWKKEMWNLFFVLGVFLGGIVTVIYFKNDQAIVVNPSLVNELSGYGLTEINGLVPEQLFSWESLGTARGLIMMVFGGFLVGFGTRYAGGCTSGHAIMGLSNLQLPSLIATISFMVGGFIMANLILPYILSL